MARSISRGPSAARLATERARTTEHAKAGETEAVGAAAVEIELQRCRLWRPGGRDQPSRASVRHERPAHAVHQRERRRRPLTGRR